ncbi:MAG TPA: hypothetical protein VM638_05705, partial [Actinomycetota bacterium]|nr:hypothetical protein [Actinomycetota bacterium]
MRRTTAAAVILGMVAAACARSEASEQERPRLVPMSGGVQVLNGESWEPVSDEVELGPDMQVRVGRSSRARLELPAGQTLELARDARVAVDDVLAPKVLAGSVLAYADQGLTLDVESFKVFGRQSVFRVDLSLPQRVAVYEGAATLPGSGWESPVGALQQVGVIAGAVLRGPQPLQVRPDDPWDIRLLSEAIDVGAGLLRQETGLGRQLAGDRVRTAILRALGDEVGEDELADLLDEAGAAEVVVAAVVAMTAGRPDLGTAIAEILELRRLGASWFVVAQRFGVSRTVLTSVTEVVGRILDTVERLE